MWPVSIIKPIDVADYILISPIPLLENVHGNKIFKTFWFAYLPYTQTNTVSFVCYCLYTQGNTASFVCNFPYTQGNTASFVSYCPYTHACNKLLWKYLLIHNKRTVNTKWATIDKTSPTCLSLSVSHSVFSEITVHCHTQR
jgi:hypothetical protein